MSDARQSRYLVMDALRGIGASLVITQHMPRPIEFASASIVVLDGFFVMSGVVLALVYLEKLRAGGRTLRFCVERVARFLPIHVSGVVLGGSFFVLHAFNNAPDLGAGLSATGAFLLNLVFLPASPDASPHRMLFPTNGPAWSLLAELLVNVLFAATAAYVTRSRVIALAVATGIALAYLVNFHGSLNLGADWETMAAGIVRATFSFYYGVLLAEAVPRLDKLRVPSWLPIAVFMCPVLIDMPLWLALLVAMPAALLLSCGARPTGFVAGVYHWLGRLSFAVYALHWGVIAWLKWGVHKTTGIRLTELGDAGVLLVLAVSWALAYWVDRAIDVPVRAKLIKLVRERFGSNRRPPASGSGSPPDTVQPAA